MIRDLDSRFCEIVQIAGLDYKMLDSKKIESNKQVMWFRLNKGCFNVWVKVTLKGEFYLYKVVKIYPYNVAEMYATSNTLWCIGYKYSFDEALRIL